MKAPVLIVIVTLALAILLAGWLLIAAAHSDSTPVAKLSQTVPIAGESFA